MLTLTEAAEQIGKSKSTLTRAIKSGRLSAHRNEHGDYRVEPSELFRVFNPVTNHDEPQAAPTTEQNVMVADLLNMVKSKDSEIADMRDELDDTKSRLVEHQTAARSLMSPEDFEVRLSAALKADKAEQVKQEKRWQKALSDRKLEIQQARAEADEIKQQSANQAKTLKAERDRIAALESRGLIARLFNKKPEVAG